MTIELPEQRVINHIIFNYFDPLTGPQAPAWLMVPNPITKCKIINHIIDTVPIEPAGFNKNDIIKILNVYFITKHHTRILNNLVYNTMLMRTNCTGGEVLQVFQNISDALDKSNILDDHVAICELCDHLGIGFDYRVYGCRLMRDDRAAGPSAGPSAADRAAGPSAGPSAADRAAGPSAADPTGTRYSLRYRRYRSVGPSMADKGPSIADSLRYLRYTNKKMKAVIAHYLRQQMQQNRLRRLACSDVAAIILKYSGLD